MPSLFQPTDPPDLSRVELTDDYTGNSSEVALSQAGAYQINEALKKKLTQNYPYILYNNSLELDFFFQDLTTEKIVQMYHEDTGTMLMSFSNETGGWYVFNSIFRSTGQAFNFAEVRINKSSKVVALWTHTFLIDSTTGALKSISQHEVPITGSSPISAIIF